MNKTDLEILKRALKIKMLVRHEPNNGNVAMPWNKHACDGLMKNLFFAEPFELTGYPFLNNIRKYYEDNAGRTPPNTPAKIKSSHIFAKVEDIGSIITYHPSWEGKNCHYPEPICTVTIEDVLKQIPKGLLKDVGAFEIVDDAIQNRVLAPRSFKTKQFVVTRLYAVSEDALPCEIKNQDVIYKNQRYSADEIRNIIKEENQ